MVGALANLYDSFNCKPHSISFKSGTFSTINNWLTGATLQSTHQVTPANLEI